MRDREKAAEVGKPSLRLLFRHLMVTFLLEKGACGRCIPPRLGHAERSKAQTFTRVTIRMVK